MSGCSSSSDTNNGDVQGPSSADSKTFDSLSEITDMAAHLEESSWSSIEIDLDRYFYGTKGSDKVYKIQMDFSDGKVTALADCYLISASYRIKDDEISFSRISSPKPAIDNPTCKSFEDADDAVSAFFSSDYFMTASSSKTVTFEALDVEATVTLNR